MTSSSFFDFTPPPGQKFDLGLSDDDLRFNLRKAEAKARGGKLKTWEAFVSDVDKKNTQGCLSSLLPLRNNSKLAPNEVERPAFRLPKAYVNACCKGTLALARRSGSIELMALRCNSWSCPHCRKEKSAALLHRIREGMTSRPGQQLGFVTLTVDPNKFGGVREGETYYRDREPWKPASVSQQQIDRMLETGELTKANLYKAPSEEKYREVCEAMSRELDRLRSRLSDYCKKRDLTKFNYFRVIELHRNGWPHYHLILEHPSLTVDDVAKQLQGWKLGRINFKQVKANHAKGQTAIDVAVGEIAPYLVNSETSAKAYQFAATALPENFRLWSCSQGFLSPEDSPSDVVQVVALKGHFTGYQGLYEQHCKASEPLSPSLALVHLPRTETRQLEPTYRYSTPILVPSSDTSKASPKLISRFRLEGTLAPVFFAYLLEVESLKAPKEWLREHKLTWLAPDTDELTRVQKDHALHELMKRVSCQEKTHRSFYPHYADKQEYPRYSN
jgi:hypothetical protein